jgi:hypothetical protein
MTLAEALLSRVLDLLTKFTTSRPFNNITAFREAI